MLDYITKLKILAVTSCNPGGKSFFGLPHWYQYLSFQQNFDGTCTPNFVFPGDILLILLAVLDILLHVAALVAVGAIIYGGFQYLTSQGEPEATKHALSTIINALIGLAITILAVAIVSFIGTKLG
jgi:hypothetical protein